LSPLDKIIKKVLFRNAKCFLNIGDFSIFSGKFINMREGSLFDETYINGVEDFDLSYSLYTNNSKYKFIDYTIRSPGVLRWRVSNPEGGSEILLTSSILIVSSIRRTGANQRKNYALNYHNPNNLKSREFE